MPNCKNDDKRKYKGDEPSPKGLGWCGHAEKEGTIKTGKDGKEWIIKNKKWIRHKSMPGYKKYFIWDPFHLLSIPYLIYINKDEVHIYTIKNPNTVLKIHKDLPISSFASQTADYTWAYTKHVKSYKFIEKYYDKVGRGFLFYLGNKKYISIDGNGIYSFIIDDIIEKYISDDDNYPIIIGKKNIYFLIEDMRYTERSIFPKKIDPNNVYEKYFGKREKIKKGKKFIWEFVEQPIQTKKMKSKRLSPKDISTWRKGN